MTKSDRTVSGEEGKMESEKAVEQVDERTYRITHPDETESYSARDAADILADQGLIDASDVVTWLGADLYDVQRPGQPPVSR